jgi:hypothetical protein
VHVHRYNELVLPGTSKSPPAALSDIQAYLDAQDDVATRRFKVYIRTEIYILGCGFTERSVRHGTVVLISDMS